MRIFGEPSPSTCDVSFQAMTKPPSLSAATCGESDLPNPPVPWPPVPSTVPNQPEAPSWNKYWMPSPPKVTMTKASGLPTSAATRGVSSSPGEIAAFMTPDRLLPPGP